MNQAISPFWTRWILVVFIVVFIFGVVLALVPHIVRDSIGSLYYNQYFGNEDVFATLIDPELRFQSFVYGVAGAALAAWMATAAFITHISFRNGERWAWYALLISMLVWFCGDSLVSITTGFALHALLNISMLVVLGIPVLATTRSFHTNRNET